MNMAVTQYNVDPGISAKFVVELVNDGNVVDYVNLSVLELPENWKTSASEGRIVELDAFSSTVEIVSITSYSGGYAGEYDMEIVGTLLSDETEEYIPVKVIVIQHYDVDLDIEDKEKFVEPESEVYFNISIMNQGNGVDNVHRDVVGLPNVLKSSIHFPLEHQYELAPGEVKKEVLRIVVPKNYKGDYINFSVMIYSEGDSAQRDNINASTIIERKEKSIDDSDENGLLSELFPYIILIIIIIIVFVIIGILISRRDRREEYREHAPPPRHPSPPPPPPPRKRKSRVDGAMRDLDHRRSRRGRRPGRGSHKPKDRVRWRGSALLDEKEFDEVDDEDEIDDEFDDEDEDEDVYDMDAEAEKDESDTDWDDEQNEDDWDEGEDESDWDEDDDVADDDDEDVFEIELDEDEPSKKTDVDWE
jgi:hypothetical protein